MHLKCITMSLELQEPPLAESPSRFASSEVKTIGSLTSAGLRQLASNFRDSDGR